MTRFRGSVLSRKKELRHRMASALILQQPQESVEWRERLAGQLRLFLSAHPGLWASYRPMRFEADPFVGSLRGVHWAWPRMDGERLEFHRTETFVKGRFGIAEPEPTSEIVRLESLKGALIPGLAFDREGGRLGRGKGFYDRTLAGFRGLKIGVGFSLQLVEGIPMDDWDVRMDAVITEQSVIWCGGSQWKS